MSTKINPYGNFCLKLSYSFGFREKLKKKEKRKRKKICFATAKIETKDGYEHVTTFGNTKNEMFEAKSFVS